jgi:hypothetical protein
MNHAPNAKLWGEKDNFGPAASESKSAGRSAIPLEHLARSGEA